MIVICNYILLSSFSSKSKFSVRLWLMYSVFIIIFLQAYLLMCVLSFLIHCINYCPYWCFKINFFWSHYKLLLNIYVYLFCSSVLHGKQLVLYGDEIGILCLEHMRTLLFFRKLIRHDELFTVCKCPSFFPMFDS